MAVTPIQNPVVYDIELYQGSEFQRTFAYKEGTPQAAVNLTGWLGRASCRASFDTPVVLNFDVTVDPLIGTVFVTTDAVTLSALDTYSGVWDLELFPDPNIAADERKAFRLVMGKFTLSREVTQ